MKKGILKRLEPNMIDVTTWGWKMTHVEPDLMEDGIAAQVTLYIGKAEIPVVWLLTNEQKHMFDALRTSIIEAAIADFENSLGQ